jgi:indolepyruvate ferredoxin oxidoreductase, alpha subunit
MTRKLLSGDEAIARGAWEAGCHVAAAYPGTPSTEILESLSTYKDVYSEWSTNEKVALEVALGASIAGARALACMKHVGLNVAADPLFSAAYIGARGGLVIVTADDPGLHSSQNEQDNRYYGMMAKIPVICPSDSQESKDFTRRAFDISEQFDIPVLLRITTRSAHSSSVVELGERLPRAVKGYEKQITRNMVLPAFAKVRHVDLEQRLDRVRAWNEECDLNRIETGSRQMGIVCDGVSYQYAREVFPEASFLKLGMVWPFPRELVRRFAATVDELVVVEETDPFIETQIRALYSSPGPSSLAPGPLPKITGKDKLPRTDELSPRVLRSSLLKESANAKVQTPNSAAGRSEFDARRSTLPVQGLPNRPPALCPGCPHTGIFWGLQKQKLIIGGDIGCYTLGGLPPHSAMDTCIDMGASITVAHGFDKALGTTDPRRRVAFIGDSTFFHSGITGLINTVYNQSNVITIISDNRTTGMTGHQNHPGTGETLMGKFGPIIKPEDVAKACGVKSVVVVDPYKVKETRKVVRELLAKNEPAVIINRRACALHIRLHNPVLEVDPEKCTGCKTCITLGCPALSFGKTGTVPSQGPVRLPGTVLDFSETDGAPSRGKAHIADTICVGCGMCADVCPQSAIAQATKDKGAMTKDEGQGTTSATGGAL